MKTVGIVGGSGFTGGELIRILFNHPKFEIKFIYSLSQSGKYIYDIHSDLLGKTNMNFTDQINLDIDVLFLCLGHGKSMAFLNKYDFRKDTIIIDLSSDFRLSNNKKFKSRNFLYGLPELNREKIKESISIANPGCFATAIQIGLLPLLNNNLIKNEVHVSAITGSTGAGMLNTNTNNFNWRNNNLSVYKPFNHQHLDEIYQTLNSMSNKSKVYFIPYRGNFTRGIFTSIYLECEESFETVRNIYEEFYRDHPFTFLSKNDINLKEVVNTNNCHINIKPHDSLILLTVVLDNLLKGASGQAVQNLNIIFGYEETLGLNFKGSIY
tara:strand:+ start:1284 stop:2255 length:972 start_codon:yes stop_codon:yes gene_type:complete